jgi:hypothetical protein
VSLHFTLILNVRVLAAAGGKFLYSRVPHCALILHLRVLAAAVEKKIPLHLRVV